MENNKLPKNQRRPPPQKPQILPSINGDNQNDKDRFNQAAYESAQSQLIPCQFCARTFAPERLSVHENACTAKTNSKIPTRKGVTRPGDHGL